MPAATTWRGEIELTGIQLNTREMLAFRSTLAGTMPDNPLQAGLGARLEIVGSESVVEVIGTMIYMPHTADQIRTPVSFTKDPTQPRWLADGALGGAALGFPPGLDYDIAKPFELEVLMIYRGGRQTRRYGFWVGNGEHYWCSPCNEREPFAALYKNCCYNGAGFRFSGTEAGGNLFGIFGEWDVFFTPAQYPWAVGLGGAGGQMLTLVCQPSRELRNPYIPDSISGANIGNPDDPFVTPSVPSVARNLPYDHLDLYRLDPAIDGTFDEAFQHAGDITPPDDPAGTAPTVPITWDTLSAAGFPAPTRPTSRRTQRIRSQLTVQWSGVGTTPEEASLSLVPQPALQISLNGFDPGENVYLIASCLRSTWAGPVLAPAAAPLGVTQPWTPVSLIEPRTSNNGIVPVGAITNNELVMALASSSGAPAVGARFITGGLGWNSNAVGGFAFLGAATGFSFQVPIDLTYLQNALAAYGAVANWSEGVIYLYVQAIVCPPGTAPITASQFGPGTPGGTWGVVWPHGAHLTTVDAVRVRA